MKTQNRTDMEQKPNSSRLSRCAVVLIHRRHCENCTCQDSGADRVWGELGPEGGEVLEQERGQVTIFTERPSEHRFFLCRVSTPRTPP